jgi:hypothetical protein
MDEDSCGAARSGRSGERERYVGVGVARFDFVVVIAMQVRSSEQVEWWSAGLLVSLVGTGLK